MEAITPATGVRAMEAIAPATGVRAMEVIAVIITDMRAVEDAITHHRATRLAMKLALMCRRERVSVTSKVTQNVFVPPKGQLHVNSKNGGYLACS